MKKLKKKVIDNRKHLIIPRGSFIEKRMANTGVVALKALESGMLTSNCIEAARKALERE